MLPETAVSLLPADDAAPRCAPFARELEIDPGGTAIAASMVVLVETPLPWPKPVFSHPRLVGLGSMMPLAIGPTRVLACVPRQAASADECRVTLYWHTATARGGSIHEVGQTGLATLFEHLASHHPETAPFAIGSAPTRSVLICTQGSHDVCCGTEGTRFANAAELLHPDVAVHRVSHTGGHRFAPTAMTLPDGRMWAGLDVDLLGAVLAQTAPPATAAQRCRGWWGAPMGWEQMAERAVFAELGWAIDAASRHTEIEQESDQQATVAVTVGSETWQVEVGIGRVVPTITCRAAGGLPAKPGREYIVHSLARVATDSGPIA